MEIQITEQLRSFLLAILLGMAVGVVYDLMRAVRLRQVDLDYRNHLQAFLSFAVQAEKQVGKHKSRPVYRTFQKFYDYDAELQKVLSDREPEDRFAGLKQFLREGGGESG